MYILHRKKFLDRVYALQSLISKTPSSAGAHYTICQRTYRILEAHAHGLTFLTLDRARLLRDGDEIAVDWHYVEQDYLYVADIKKWAIAAGHIAAAESWATVVVVLGSLGAERMDSPDLKPSRS